MIMNRKLDIISFCRKRNLPETSKSAPETEECTAELYPKKQRIRLFENAVYGASFTDFVVSDVF